MAQPKIKYQQISLIVSSSGQIIPIEQETDKLYNTLTGINIVLTDETARFSTIKLEVNTTEVFPEGFEVLRLKFREQAPFGYDYHGLNETAGGSKIKGNYTDKNGSSFPYRVIISLRYENKTTETKANT